MAGIKAFFADAAWLDAGRARNYARIFLGMAIAVAIGWIAASQGGIDPTGKPLGTDFTSFWSAVRIAVTGNPADVYRQAVHAAIERSIFDGGDRGYFAFYYPPIFLLYLLPLGALPYLPALVLWLAVTGAAAWAAIARLLPGRGWLAAAYPATFMTLGHGQNALLSTALFGAAALTIERRPWLAGISLGALVYKPQLGLMIPLLLVAAGRWRVFAAATLTVLGLSLLSWLVFGAGAWTGFLAMSTAARDTLDGDGVGYHKMVSVFAALRLAGGSVGLAYAGQGLAFAAAAVALVWQARRWPGPAQLATLVVASCLSTPFLLDYDLMLLAVPMAWLLGRGLADGFLPYEKTVLAAAFITPLVARTLAAHTFLQLAPLVVGLLLLVMLQRGRHDAAVSQTSRNAH